MAKKEKKPKKEKAPKAPKAAKASKAPKKPAGMAMPGARKRGQRSVPNVYTALALAAVVALAVAIGVVYMAGTKVGPGGDAMSAFKLQDPDRIKLGR